MSCNSFRETMLCRYEYPGGPFFIARDLAGNCVLRVGRRTGKNCSPTNWTTGQRIKNMSVCVMPFCSCKK